MATSNNSKSGKSSKAAPAAPAAKPTPNPAAKASAAAPAAKVSAPAKARAPYEPTQEEIQTRAFEIYLSEGCKEGNDLEYWLRAEQDMRLKK